MSSRVAGSVGRAESLSSSFDDKKVPGSNAGGVESSLNGHCVSANIKKRLNEDCKHGDERGCHQNKGAGKSDGSLGKRNEGHKHDGCSNHEGANRHKNSMNEQSTRHHSPSSGVKSGSPLNHNQVAASGSNHQVVGSSSFNTSQNPALQQWAPDIQKAANLTKIDPNTIAAQMWAESRGDGSSKENSKNMDGTTDRSLMQISDERWQRDVIPTLSSEDKANIKAVTGKDPSQLNMSDPHDNVIAGAFELRSHIVDNGGSADNPMNDNSALKNGLAAYRGVGDGKDDQYAEQVINDANNLVNNRRLNDNEAL